MNQMSPYERMSDRMKERAVGGREGGIEGEGGKKGGLTKENI